MTNLLGRKSKPMKSSTLHSGVTVTKETAFLKLFIGLDLDLSLWDFTKHQARNFF